MLKNYAMTVSDDSLCLAYTIMWASTSGWEPNYYTMYWDSGRWIMFIQFLERHKER